MAGDDLEYYIKFPSPTPKDSSPLSDTEEFVFLYDEDKLPVVMLLGWAGCQDKYLSKYSAIYEERGCITVRYTAPIECLFWRRGHLKQLGERLVELITDMSLEDHPIFFHIFSNGGAYLYQHVIRAILTHKKKFKVKGAIFDSSPGKTSVPKIYRTLSAIIGGSWYYNIVVTFACTVVCLLFWFFETLIRAIWERKPLRFDPLILADQSANWPQLYIYSKADKLIDFKEVEEFMRHQREQGINTVSLRFDDSPHVQHFLTYKEKYINQICSFLQLCLSNDDNTTLD